METEFKPIPGFSRYGINTEGQILNFQSGRLLSTYQRDRGYKYNILVNDAGKRQHLQQHRALMLAYKYPNQDPSTLVIDHIDCNPANNSLDNLEWVTSAENSRRAADNGLMTGEYLETVLYDENTHQRLYFPSLAACARFVGLTNGAVRYRISRGPQYVAPDGYRYAFVADNPDFENIPPVYDFGRDTEVLLRNIFTNEIRHFSQLQQASAFLGVCPAYLSTAMLHGKQPVLLHGWQLKLVSDPDPWRECDYWKEISDRSYTIKVIEVLYAGFIYYFETLKEAAEYFGLKITAAQYRATTLGETLFSDGTRWAYYPYLTENHCTFI